MSVTVATVHARRWWASFERRGQQRDGSADLGDLADRRHLAPAHLRRSDGGGCADSPRRERGIAESRVARQQAGEIAERQAAQSRRDGLMEYGKMAVDLLLSDKPDLMTRGEAMIAYLSSLPPEILPAEDRDLLIAMMTVGVARGEYSGVISMIEPATSAPSGSAVSANTADEA